MRSRLVSAVFTCTALVLAAGCGSSSDDTSTSAAGSTTSTTATSGTITLGAVLPLTGDNATLGADQSRGIELAVADINANGGVLGKKLAVTIEDSQGDTNAALQAAKKLVTVDKVPVVIGE